MRRPVDLVVEGRAFVAGRLQECSIAVEGGRIARVARTLPSSATAGARRMRVPRGLVLPGAVDAHVHFRDPGATHKEDVASGTLAALHGGTTTVLDMPNTTPPVTTKEAFEAKRARFEAAARVDWALHAMVDPELRSFALGGLPVGYKAYLGPTTNADAFPAARLAEALRACSAARRPLVVHAEHPAHLRAAGRDDWRAHGLDRPAEAEWEGIRAVAAAHRGRARVLLAHATTAKGLRLARRAGIGAEVTPHHLLLDEGALRKGPRAKVNPPLRSASERAALWKAFAAGQGTTLGSDHAPHTLAEKARSYAKAPSGVPGVETLLPLMLAKVAARSLGLGVLVKAASTAPAELFGLRKGRIARGFDADLVVADLRDARRVRAQDLHSRCGWTPFEGHRAVFPRLVVLRGDVALEDGKTQGVRGAEAVPAG